MSAPESIIEIGSTGVRLLVAEFTEENKQNVLDRSEKPLPIGRDIFTNGLISQEIQNQLINILILFREQLFAWGITPEQTACITASTFRDAKNSDPVMDRVLVQTGFKIRIIDGIEENRLMYIGVLDCLKDSNLDLRNDDAVILNVGGSTTEIMLISDGKMAGVHSLRLGTIRIEQHMKIQTSSYSDIYRFVRESINNTKGTLENELNLENVRTFMAIGPDLTLAALLIGHPVSTFMWEIYKQDFVEFVKDVQDYSVDEIVARFKISYNEAETLQVSLLIYSLFLNLTKAEKIFVPETSVRNGFLLSRFSGNTDELKQEFNSQIIASTRNILRKYRGDEDHSECVRTISLKIYDALQSVLALDEHARLLLEIAALLHDIGVFIRYDNHNIHSSYIIRNSEIFGLSHNDIKIVAEIAKYHRGNTMPQDDDSFQSLPRADRMTILKLTAILRIADALDRGHIQKYSDFEITIQQSNLIIRAKKSRNSVLERIALTEKAGMFESIFGYKVILS